MSEFLKRMKQKIDKKEKENTERMLVFLKQNPDEIKKTIETIHAVVNGRYRYVRGIDLFSLKEGNIEEIAYVCSVLNICE